MDIIAGLNNAQIIKCRLREASALGAAMLAGLSAGIFDSIAQLEDLAYNDEPVSSAGVDSAVADKYLQWTEILKELK